MICGGIIVGMFAMHSLTQDHVQISNHAMAANESPAVVAANTSAEVSLVPAKHDGDHRGSSLGVDHCGMLAMCLLAIAAGVALLWFFGSSHGRRAFAHLKRVVPTGRQFVQTAFRQPPDLVSLSILRC